MADVRYDNREFSSIQRELVGFTKTYYPEKFQDFGEASLGMLYLDLTAYVGDVLSFYADTSFRETLIEFAEEKENVYTIARQLGYKPKLNRPAFTKIDVYGVVPRSSSDPTEPDFSNVPSIKPGMTVSAETGDASFRVQTSVDFSNPDTIQVYENDAFGQPSSFLVKKRVDAVAGKLRSTVFEFGESEKLAQRRMPDVDIVEVLGGKDSQGREWKKVDSLSQNSVFEEQPNLVSRTPDKVLGIVKAENRFTVVPTADGSLYLQFGAGNNVGRSLRPDAEFSLSDPVSPTSVLDNTYGTIPRNTSIEVQYIEGGGTASNVGSNSIRTIENADFDFSDVGDNDDAQTFQSTVQVTQPKPATGGAEPETIEEVRRNALGFFDAQSRVVTAADYETRALSLPERFGSIAKASATRSGNGNVDLRVLGYDDNENLEPLGNIVKQNIRQYIARYKPLGDVVQISDGAVVNVAVDIEVRLYKSAEGNEGKVKQEIIDAVSGFFDPKTVEFSSPVVIGEIIDVVQNTNAVRSVLNIEIQNKVDSSEGYSGNRYNIANATRDGVVYPSQDPSVFTVRFPEKDVRVRIQ